MQTSLGSRLRLERLRRGLTITQVSDGSGVARNTLTQLEHGQRKPTTPTVRKLTDFYGLDYGALFEEVYGDPKAPTPPATESSRAGAVEEGLETGESDEDMRAMLYQAALNIYQSRRADTLSFEELSLKERQRVLEDVVKAVNLARNWRMYGAGEAVMLLNELLTQTALRLVELYDQLLDDEHQDRAEGAEVHDIEEARELRRKLRQEAS